MKRNTIPPLTSGNSNLAPQIAKLQKFKDEHAQKQAALAQAWQDYHTQPVHGGNTIKLRKISEILGDEVQPVGVSKPEIAKLIEEIAVLEAAIVEMEKRVTREKAVASVAIVKQLEGHHAALVADIVKGLAASHEAAVAYNQFKDDCQTAEVSVAMFNPIATSFQSRADHFMSEAVRGKFVKASAVPEKVL